jgi:glycosyltransferase involved in cell wall biosynthesis
VAGSPVVLVLAPEPVDLRFPPEFHGDSGPLDCRWYPDDAELNAHLAREHPDVIVSFGALARYPRLRAAPHHVRRRWLHFDVARPSAAERARIGALVVCYYVRRLFATEAAGASPPLVSVFTPACRPGPRIDRAYRSLCAQSFDNWEWVVVDDSDDGGATWRRLAALAGTDPRVLAHASTRTGRIGEAKRRACALARGDILVELDHDDELTPNALADIVTAFREHPDAGFVYSDWVELDERTGASLTYPAGWAFGYGRYRVELYRGRPVQVAVAPPIDGTTIRHIVSAPNHVRAWRREAYWRIGGHNPGFAVADDYELLVRTFLHVRMVHVPKLCYVQYRNTGANAQDRRRADIQRLARIVREHYESRIHDRLLQLGLADPYGPGDTGGAAASGTPDEPGATGGAPAGRVIVTFTTLPSRIEHLRPMVESLRRQTRAPDEVRLYLPPASVRERASYVVPGWLAAAGVTVVRAERDWGPATKLLPCLVEGGHPDDLIITVDDDVVYERHLVEDLVAAAAADGASAWCMAGVDDAGRFVDAERVTMPTPVTVMRGYRGILYRRRFFDVAALVREHAATTTGDVHLADDHLFSGHLASRGVARFVVAPARTFRCLDLGHGILAPGEAPAARRAAQAVIDHYERRCRDLSVVVLDATAGEQAVACLRSVRRWCPGAEIVLVGNGVDSHARDLADVYLRLEGNVGVAAGWNLGARRATRPYLCFLNDDAEFVDGETPVRLLGAAATGAVVGPYSNRARPPQGDVARSDVPAVDRRVDGVVGVCLVVARPLFERVGGFDARFLTWEDDDFCARAGAVGAECVIAGGAWVAHRGHATFAALGLDAEALMRRGRRRFEQKHAPIRVAAIARDEEQAIGEYFAQFRDVTAQRVLVDTGSTDRTAEMAERAGARVEFHPDVEVTGFAAARNAAHGEAETWVVMLDPDERLDRHTIAAIPELIASAGHRFDAFLAPLEAIYPDGTRRTFVPKPFLYRREACCWRYLVHEKLVGGRQALVTNARIEHLLALHPPGRRRRAEALYRRLAAREPYFTDAAYRAAQREAWPILDHERVDDARIAKIHVGPLVSVVVPTFDRPALCARAVRSALAQDWATLEVIVVGDGCPRFDALLEALGDDPRVRGINLPANHGPGGAVPRNVGIDAAAGEWIAYLDDDNAWDPDHVSSVMGAIRRVGASWGFSSMRTPDGTDLGFAAPAPGRVDTSCVVHARRLVARYGPWRSLRETGNYAHDWELFARWVDGGERWAATGAPTVVYNTETSSQAAFVRGLARARRALTS